MFDIPVSTLALRPAAELLAPQALAPGTVTAVVESLPLTMTLGANARSPEQWTAVVGFAHLNPEAWWEAGFDLRYTVFVDVLRPAGPEVLSALVDGFALVILQWSQPLSPTNTRRLAARLRKRKSRLIAFGPEPWPEADFSYRPLEVEWTGLGQGHGYLTKRCIQARVASRRGQSRVESFVA